MRRFRNIQLGIPNLGMVRNPHRIILKTVRINPHYALKGEQDFWACVLTFPCFAMNFIAVMAPVNFRRALYTFPNDPSPTNSRMW
mgnify:CR=1 FL=1